MANRPSVSNNQASKLEESLYLDEGETHEVWTPPQQGSIQEDGRGAQQRTTNQRPISQKDIFERKRELVNRVEATRRVLRLQSVEYERETGRRQERECLTPTERKTWQSTLRDTYSERARASRKIALQTTRPFHAAVAHCAAEAARSGGRKRKMTTSLETHEAVKQWTHEYSRMASNASVLANDQGRENVD